MAIAAAVMIVAAALMAVVLAHALVRIVARRALFPDRPNGRSSHKKTTPRSGGFAIFGGFAASMGLFAALLAANGVANLYLPLLGFSFLAFAFGAADDSWRLGARLKLAAQIAIAIGFTLVVGPVGTIPAPFLGEIALGWAAFPLTVFWIVAFMNALNFMDGIDGIAGAAAVFVLAALAVAAAGGGAPLWAPAALFLACATFGFLPMNFPRARLFMGDGGSQFLGFSIAALAVLIAKAGATTPLFAPIAFMPFLFDVSFTLAHRVRRKRNILEAHQEHLYQLLVRMGRSHLSVTTLYLTLVTVSTAVAIIANALDPRLQLLAAALLIVVFLPLAIVIWRRADARGLFAAPDHYALPPEEENRGLAAAAE